MKLTDLFELEVNIIRFDRLVHLIEMQGIYILFIFQIE